MRSKYSACELIYPLAAFGLISMSMTASARADWAFTRWGMTIEEALSASSGLAKPIPEEEIKAKSTFRGAECLAYIPNYVVSDFSFESRLCFDANGALSSVVLYTDGTPGQFHALDRALRAAYGAPIEERDGSIPLRSWRDQSSNNYIRLLGLVPTAVIEYKSAQNGF